MSTLEEFNGAVEASLYNKFTRYGKMTMHFYHNEQFILKIYSYKPFFKQGSDETLFCIAFARFVSGFQLRAYPRADGAKRRARVLIPPGYLHPGKRKH
jgi:hypothetical protein